MKDEMKDEHFEKKMRMWKMREELLNSMDVKELRAFIKGYLMAESRRRREMRMSGCGCGNCGCGGCNCGNSGSGNCECKGESCNCEK